MTRTQPNPTQPTNLLKLTQLDRLGWIKSVLTDWWIGCTPLISFSLLLLLLFLFLFFFLFFSFKLLEADLVQCWLFSILNFSYFISKVKSKYGKYWLVEYRVIHKKWYRRFVFTNYVHPFTFLHWTRDLKSRFPLKSHDFKSIKSPL